MKLDAPEKETGTRNRFRAQLAFLRVTNARSLAQVSKSRQSEVMFLGKTIEDFGR